MSQVIRWTAFHDHWGKEVAAFAVETADGEDSGLERDLEIAFEDERRRGRQRRRHKGPYPFAACARGVVGSRLAAPHPVGPLHVKQD